MRYDADHKARTRGRVLQEAAAAIRTVGPDRVSVAAVMARAGLTQGAFYAHFTSKDALVAEAIGQMFDESSQTYAGEDAGDDPAAALDHYVDGYLSMRHRDARDRGCPLPILAGELHRYPAATRDRFKAALGRMRIKLGDLLERAAIDRPQERALDALAEMIGVVALARVVDDAEAETLLAIGRASVRRKFQVAAVENRTRFQVDFARTRQAVRTLE